MTKQAKNPVLAAKSNISRRTLIKGATATGAFALAGPAYVKNAMSSSGEINILMWSDYLPEKFIGDFEKETGIKINYTGIGSNEEIINKMKANKGQGFDIVSPTNNQGLEWGPLELLQPFDMSKVPADKVNPAMTKIGDKDWQFPSWIHRMFDRQPGIKTLFFHGFELGGGRPSRFTCFGNGCDGFVVGCQMLGQRVISGQSNKARSENRIWPGGEDLNSL